MNRVQPSRRIPCPNLTFVDNDTARAGSLTPVKGPRLVLVIDNERAVPVTLNLGVYGTN